MGRTRHPGLIGIVRGGAVASGAALQYKNILATIIVDANECFISYEGEKLKSFRDFLVKACGVSRPYPFDYDLLLIDNVPYQKYVSIQPDIEVTSQGAESFYEDELDVSDLQMHIDILGLSETYSDFSSVDDLLHHLDSIRFVAEEQFETSVRQVFRPEAADIILEPRPGRTTISHQEALQDWISHRIVALKETPIFGDDKEKCVWHQLARPESNATIPHFVWAVDDVSNPRIPPPNTMETHPSYNQLVQNDPTAVVYYHATSTAVAEAILREGFDFDFARPRLDFFRAPAIYFTPSISAAVDWCCSRFLRPPLGAAILIFRFDITQYVPSDQRASYSTASEAWKQHIKICRSKFVPQNLTEEAMRLKSLRVVYGPICKGPNFTMDPQPLEDWFHLAVSDDMLVAVDIFPTLIGVMEIVR